MSDHVNGKTAIVTGGSRGIGRAIAEALGAEGFNVAINYNRNRDAADEAAQGVRAAGGGAHVVQADVAATEDRERLVAETTQQFGPIGLLVNNAGMAPPVRADLLEATEDSFDQVLATNLKGPYFLSQRVANHMVEHRGAFPKDRFPMIVNIGSLSAYASSTNRGEYCVAKAAMGMMTKLFADRLADEGINVYEVRPGIIQTDMTSGVKEKYDRLIVEEGLTPIRRWGQPADLAKAVVALARCDFPFTTGEAINVDGGFHLHRL